MDTPPPQELKHSIIKSYARKHKLEIFIETGTYLGDTLAACRHSFKRLISIELDATLFKNATERFKRNKKVTILQGDSGEVIEKVLETINEPCLFWLDGHYSDGITAKGELNTPIIKELTNILKCYNDNHVILIDDARLFIGEFDYPTIEYLSNFIMNINPMLQVLVDEDIIRIHKKLAVGSTNISDIIDA